MLFRMIYPIFLSSITSQTFWTISVFFRFFLFLIRLPPTVFLCVYYSAFHLLSQTKRTLFSQLSPQWSITTNRKSHPIIKGPYSVCPFTPYIVAPYIRWQLTIALQNQLCSRALPTGLSKWKRELFLILIYPSTFLNKNYLLPYIVRLTRADF